ncbi:MAG: ABC transporter substrate-binding protein [Acidaminobacteraceae bacterium]
MKNYIKVLVLMMVALLAFTACSTLDDKGVDTDNANGEIAIKKIGITQLVEHPSLDTIRSGAIQALVDAGYNDGENIEIEFLNAQGSMENTNTIANEFSNKEFDVVLGITTPSAQALFNKVKNTPIIYTAVTDPVSAGLVGENISGVSDMTPVKKQFDLLIELLPDTEIVGMIYNSSELNSEIQVEIAKEVSAEMGLELLVTSITNSNEVSLALDYILEEADVLYVQKDNTLASAFPIVVKKADAKNIPIIGAVTDFVDAGALATDGPSEFEIGYESGKMLVSILEGKDVADIEAKLVDTTRRVFNLEVAKKYKVEIKE